jgi:hypothetical protein
VNDIGRPGEAPGLGDSDEGAKLIDVEQGGHDGALENRARPQRHPAEKSSPRLMR